MQVMDAAVRAKLDSLPPAPGVYVFRDKRGGCLYVGKAANLRTRVRSYFQHRTGDQRHFVTRLERELGDLETFVVATEKEAALLENSLIKEQRPRHNIKLRDDKEFLSLRLNASEPWPRLEAVRRPRQDGARYFGPYHAALAARSTLRLVNRHFRLRTCTDAEFRSRTRPCLQFQIKRCPAPCVLEVDREEYAEQVRDVSLFLEGRHDELIKHLQRKMKRASDRLEYEQAAVCRNQIRALDSALQPQRVSRVSNLDQDVFGYYRDGDRAQFAVLWTRRGRVTAVRAYELREVQVPSDELIASFVAEYYGRGSYVPNEVLLPEKIEAMQGLADVLSDQRGTRTKLMCPQRGSKVRLLRMAMDNAEHAYRENAKARDSRSAHLAQIMKRLALPKLPARIECVDISHDSGADTVAAVVAFEQGEPDRKRYRTFRVRSAAAADDYGAMSEVLARRFHRSRKAEAGWDLPDLLVVDGGKGQLNIALSVLNELQIQDLPVIALAKEKEDARGEKRLDRIYVPGRKDPILLRENAHALNLLAQARDEAHRVSNRFRLKLAKRRKLRSDVDEIQGVGPKTRTRLLKHLGSVRAIKSASVEQLLAAGATRRQALAIHQAFGTPPPDAAPNDAPPAAPHDALQESPDDAEQAAIDNAFVTEENGE